MPGRVALAVRGARRAAPLAIEAYRRWERMTPEERERYKAIMRRSGKRARGVYEQTRERILRRRGR